MPAVFAFYALIPYVYYDVLGAERQNPLHSLLVFDLGGITHFSGKNQFPVAWSDGGDRAADQQVLRPGAVGHLLAHAALPVRDEAARARTRSSARRAWSRRGGARSPPSPSPICSHRATFMWTFLAGSNLVLPYYDWQGPTATYGSNPYFKPLLALHHLLQPTVLCLQLFWLILAVGVCAIALAGARDTRRRIRRRRHAPRRSSTS